MPVQSQINLEILQSEYPKVKYAYAKELALLAKSGPEILYPYYDEIITLFQHKSNILKWNAIDIIGLLSSVDAENKTKKQFSQLFKFLHGGHLITCNHAIYALGLIAQNKPEHQKKIFLELLKVAEDSFDTEECKNIAIGNVLSVFNKLSDKIKLLPEIQIFIQNATANSRNSTKNKALKLVNKFGSIKAAAKIDT